MRGAIPPAPIHFMAWCLVKHRDNFTFAGSLNYVFIFNMTDKHKSDRFINWRRGGRGVLDGEV
jgi:hypothetical protein